MQVIIFLHGWGKSKKDYKELLDLLVKKYTVYALDLPGFGQTPIDRPFDLDDYVSYVYKFIKKKNLEKVVLAGHSFGGRVSIKFALKYPELLKKLILIGSHGIERKNLLIKSINSIKSIKLITPDFFQRIFRQVFGSNDYLGASPAMRETMKKVVGENLEPELSKIKVPTQLIWGENDHTTPIWMGKVMTAQIQGSTLSVIAGGDHGVPYRKVKEVANAILNN